MRPESTPLKSEPLILSLLLDQAAQAWFEARRAAHFPADRLVVGAHVTMFHALPGDRAAELAARLGSRAAGLTAMQVTVVGLRLLGRGVAYELRIPRAEELRASIAADYDSLLTAQDRAPWRPHITIQNKVPPEQARRTLALLAAEMPPAPIAATGLGLWRYRGGPWEPVGRLAFG